MNSEQAWQKQNKTIEYYREHQPETLKHPVKKTEAEIFSEIGIGNLPLGRLPGYLRLFPQDFIVEEKMFGGGVVKINEFLASKPNRGERDNTLYAHLIKIGIPTNVAIERLADNFNFDINKIGFAGLKDADALTAQLIAFSGGKILIEEIEKKKIPNIILTNLHYSTHSLAPGDLAANIFTITVRTEESLDEMAVKTRVEMIEKYGVLNYFQSQRFGGLRLLSHKLGKLILQGNYDLAIRLFLFKTSSDDIPLIIKLRKEAEKSFPDWQKIEKIFKELPYTFANELKVARYLAENKDNVIGALIEIKDQTQLWVYAYSSLLFNKYLTLYSKTRGVVEEKLPVFLSDDSADSRLYQNYLKEDKTLNWRKNLRPFKFIQIKKRLTSGRVWPTEINYRLFDGGAVIKFALGKGSYATTMLANLFELRQGLPTPEWLDTTETDPKEILGQGSIKQVRELLKDYWYSKKDLEI